MLIQFLGLFVVLITFFVALMDLLPLFKDWVSRIHIGRYEDQSKWNERVMKRAVVWLNHTPKIKVTDNTRLTVLDRLKGNYSKNAIQYWQEAAIILGLIEQLKMAGNKDVEEEIRFFLNRKFNENGEWKQNPEHVDGAILAYAVMKVSFVETDHYKPALDSTWMLIQEHIGKDGTSGYRKSMETYRYVDTIGFICPFLIAYGVRYKKPECVELAVKQISEYNLHGMSARSFIPSHAYSTESSLPLGLSGWGRGLGWYAIGLIDSWNELPDQHEYKNLLQNSVKKFAQAALQFQQLNGSWNWTVTRKEARPDSSTTATLSWFLANAANINEISKECLHGAERGLAYLMTVTRRSGAIDFSQGDTKDIGVYSMLFNVLPFTQGFSLRTVSFLINKKETIKNNTDTAFLDNRQQLISKEVKLS